MNPERLKSLSGGALEKAYKMSWSSVVKSLYSDLEG
jgi:hypothetical protein